MPAGKFLVGCFSAGDVAPGNGLWNMAVDGKSPGVPATIGAVPTTTGRFLPMTWRFSDDDGNTSGVKRCTLDVAGETPGGKRCAPDDSGDAPGDSGDTPGDDRCMKINDLCKYDPKRPKTAVFDDGGEKLRSAGVLARSKVDISGDHEKGRFLTLPRCCARGRARSGAGKKQACRRGGRSYS
jgi:hypothetical protein